MRKKIWSAPSEHLAPRGGIVFDYAVHFKAFHLKKLAKNAIIKTNYSRGNFFYADEQIIR